MTTSRGNGPHRSAGAIDGLLVLDLSQILAGPYCTMMLADLGATVVKVERPGRGDDTRAWGPPWADDGSSTYFHSVNRGKRSVAIDLKTAAGSELALRLAQRADVMIQNFRPGVIGKLGLDYQTVARLNPRIVYCSLSSFGSDGPYAQRAGYDALIQAMGGLMSITGPEAGPATKVGVAIVDILAGQNALSGILAALYYRERTGKGQHIDIALLDSLVGALANQAQSYLITGRPPGRLGNAHPSIAPYQTFAASDGQLMLAVGNDDQFGRLCQALGRAELALDPRFSTNEQRVLHRAELTATIERELTRDTVASWLRVLEDAVVPAGPVNDLAAVFADPQVAHREMLAELPGEHGQPLRFVGNPIKMGQTPTCPRMAPPRLGSHTDEVLSGLLSLSEDELSRLRKAGAIFSG